MAGDYQPDEVVTVVLSGGTRARLLYANACRMGLRPAQEDTSAPVEEQTPVARPKTSDVRAWAAANGVPCPAKGRVPDAVIEAYNNR